MRGGELERGAGEERAPRIGELVRGGELSIARGGELAAIFYIFVINGRKDVATCKN